MIRNFKIRKEIMGQIFNEISSLIFWNKKTPILIVKLKWNDY